MEYRRRHLLGCAGMSDVRRLWIEGPAGRLEALLRFAAEPRGAAVIAHPHPQHGGTMHNPVIFHTDRELNRAGFVTLRFNFRGVGESDGAYDEARGEIDDAEHALRWLRGLTDAPLFAVGFSFGSYCALSAARRDGRVQGFVGIGMPARSYDFAPLMGGMPVAAVHAEEDELTTPDELRAVLGGAPLRLVPGTTHLFPGRAPDAAREVVAAVLAML
jgi:uncharacterized protein